MLTITICPTCNSDKIKPVRCNWSSAFQGIKYTVPELEFYECPDCGERVFDQQAMSKIRDYSPAYAHQRWKKVA